MILDNMQLNWVQMEQGFYMHKRIVNMYIFLLYIM